MTDARPLVRWRIFSLVWLGVGSLLGGPLGHAAGTAGREARPAATGHDKPPVRLLDQILTLGGSGAAQESLGAAGSWQEVRAAIVAEFKPTAELITAEARPVAGAKPLAKAAAVNPATPTLVRAVSETPGELDPVSQADAARQVYERPVNIRTVELAATIEADGRLSTLTVLTPSGSSAFDDTAAAAVRRGLRDRPSADPGSRVLVRLRLSAGRAIAPRVAPVREPAPPRIGPPAPAGPAGSLEHAATSGAGPADYPLSNRLNSQVELISVTSAPPVKPAKATGAASPTTR